MTNVIRQQSKTDSQLKRDGFKDYSRKKELVMARRLPAADAPLEIKTNWGETLIAKAGYMICYNTANQFFDNVSQYDHWPVEPQIFEETYKPWDEAFLPDKAGLQLLAALGHSFCSAGNLRDGARQCGPGHGREGAWLP